ncbi:MAG: hypothetical protein JNM94_00300 [Phycisphaerae bacterium]|nr:hypothetical protein [Phycisphaerae bacterium]
MSFALPCRLALVTVLLSSVGCTSHTETFEGKSREQVWTAMVRAAENPVYSDWHVIENDAWAYDADSRIEVWRLLRRYNDKQNQWARLEDSEWLFTIVLLDTDPPSATFDVRSMCVPSHGWEQRENYFKQVWDLLGGPNAMTPPPAPSAPEPAAPTAASNVAPTPAPATPSGAEPAPATPSSPEKPPVDLPE